MTKALRFAIFWRRPYKSDNQYFSVCFQRLMVIEDTVSARCHIRQLVAYSHAFMVWLAALCLLVLAALALERGRWLTTGALGSLLLALLALNGLDPDRFIAAQNLR